MYPTLTVFPFSILSGISRDKGLLAEADRWTSAQYISYFIHDIFLATCGIYYGINFMLILRGTVKQFSRASTSFIKSRNGTREALDRLKYTMTYIAVLPLISGPWWGIFGIYHAQIINSINGVNLFLSGMWHVAGIQPLIVVVQYVLAKRVYLHFTGQLQSSGGGDSSLSDSQSQTVTVTEVTDHRPTLNRTRKNEGIVVDVDTVTFVKTTDSKSNDDDDKSNDNDSSKDSSGNSSNGSENSFNSTEGEYTIDMKPLRKSFVVSGKKSLQDLDLQDLTVHFPETNYDLRLNSDPSHKV